MCINCGPTFGCTDTCPPAYQNSRPAVRTPEETIELKQMQRDFINTTIAQEPESVDHPQHYGGDTPYEAIKVIEAWELGFCLGNAVKYISRAGKKDKARTVEDLKKAAWYLAREIEKLED